MINMRRTAEQAAETRRTIIRTALAEFAAHGWTGGSLVSIARRAGLTRGAVYHHFESKEALLRAVLIEEWTAQTPAVLATLNTDAPATDRLQAFLQTYLDLLGSDSTFRDLAVVSTIVAPQVVELAEGIEEKRNALNRWSDALEPVLAACGPLRDGLTIDDALFVIFTFIHGLTLTAATEPQRLPRGTTIPAICEAIVDGLLPSSRLTAEETS